jgi:prepilin-type N-terminal cleavage/methylation domain-containing protein
MDKVSVASRCRRRERGFTLIELMVACAIVGILTALAYPSYRNYVIRGQLVDATNGLSGMRANMERYYQDNRSYTGANSPCAASITSGKFTLSCDATTSTTTFKLNAVGTGPVAAFTFTVDNSNNQTTTVATGAPSGWSGCTTAWVTKPGGC